MDKIKYPLTQNNEVIAETAEYQTPSRSLVSLKRNSKVPSQSYTVVDVDINNTEQIKVEVTPDQLWLSANPNNVNPVSMHTAVKANLLPLQDAGWNSPIRSIAMNFIGWGGDEKCSFFSC